MTNCEMNAVVELANTSMHPATRPGRLSGSVTRTSVRHFDAPSAAEASRRLGSIRDMTLSNGRSRRGISIWVRAITSPCSVCKRRSGAGARPSHSSAWLMTPSRPRITIHANVRTTTDVSSGRITTKRITRCQRGPAPRYTSATG